MKNGVPQLPLPFVSDGTMGAGPVIVVGAPLCYQDASVAAAIALRLKRRRREPVSAGPLAKVRRRLGLTLREAASALGTTIADVRRLEKNDLSAREALPLLGALEDYARLLAAFQSNAGVQGIGQ